MRLEQSKLGARPSPGRSQLRICVFSAADFADCEPSIGKDCKIRLHILAGNVDYPIAFLTGMPTRPKCPFAHPGGRRTMGGAYSDDYDANRLA